MIFSSLIENEAFRHFQMFSTSTPYGGRPPLNVAGRPRPQGRQAGCSSTQSAALICTTVTSVLVAASRRPPRP